MKVDKLDKSTFLHNLVPLRFFFICLVDLCRIIIPPFFPLWGCLYFSTLSTTVLTEYQVL